jgi:methylated-DNA-protein-cysteine methyltransferase related protein
MAHAARAKQIERLVRSLPPGFVTTYGDLCPRAPRFVGAVLARTRADLPWHRVVRADGSLAKGRRQRELLEAEGVPFRGDRVEMAKAHLPRSAFSY